MIKCPEAQYDLRIGLFFSSLLFLLIVSLRCVLLVPHLSLQQLPPRFSAASPMLRRFIERYLLHASILLQLNEATYLLHLASTGGLRDIHV